jgi:hypothetical protein
MVVASPCIIKAIFGLRVQHYQVVGDSIVVVSPEHHQSHTLLAASVEINVDLARNSILEAL